MIFFSNKLIHSFTIIYHLLITKFLQINMLHASCYIIRVILYLIMAKTLVAPQPVSPIRLYFELCDAIVFKINTLKDF